MRTYQRICFCVWTTHRGSDSLMGREAYDDFST